MHWYRSATCVCDLINTHSAPLTVPRYTKFVTRDKSICYTNMEQIELPSGATNDQVYQTTLVQGTPRTPSKVSQYAVPDPNQPWHSIYNYNVLARDIVNNIYTLNDKNVDESTITIVDNNGEEWHQVDSLALQISSGKFFEFKIDEYDRPYIELVDYWEKFDVTQLKLFYLLSDGFNGSITDGMLTGLDSNVYIITNKNNQTVVNSANDYLKISNFASTLGQDPETAAEARVESRKYVNTYDTLITLDDFTRAGLRCEGVANCIALDCTNDPNLDPETDLYQVVLYIVREEEYESDDPEAYKQQVLTELKDYKLMPLTLVINLEDIKFFYWTVTGTLYLKEPVSIDTAKDIITAVNNRLKFIYSPEYINFNEEIKFIDVVDTIREVSPLIHYVELDPISYQVIKTKPETGEEYFEPVDKSLISGNKTKTISVLNNPDPSDNLVYNFTLLKEGDPPIKPGTVAIRLNNGNYILKDNSNGKIMNYNNILRKDGTIDYKTGNITFEVNEPLTTDLYVLYTSNTISMPRYMNLDTATFNIANESLKV